MFNKSYYAWPGRGGMVPAREVLDEIVERAADRQRFDRPKRRPKPGAKTKPSLQLELFA